jgi:amino acid adenylation domain-containing protein
LEVPLIDLRDVPESEREAQLGQLAKDEARRPFNLARGPLLRVSLLRLGAEEHVLLLTVHHIVFDGWSEGVFFWELGVLYEAFRVGEPSPLAEPPVQYADFALWQREWLRGKMLETQLSYWKRRLEGAPTVLELPTDRPRPPVKTANGATRTFCLSENLSAALKGLSRREEVTLFMTLLAAFQTLLYRYTGQDYVLVGVPVAGRNRLETEGLIGIFINTLVLCGDLSGDPSFRELLGRVREAAFGAYTHQDLPFEKLVERLRPERSLRHHPIFQVMFQLRNVPKDPVELAGLKIEDFEFDSGIAKMDLTLEMVEKAENLFCTFEYNTDLFDAATIDRIQEHFRTLLEGIVAAPEQRVSKLPLLSEAERRQLLVEWNDTQTDYPKDRCVHELFEEQVERIPEAVALVFEDQQLTYRELNRQANRLAHHLRSLGVGPEVLVGICVERSVEMVVGLLGILKAGGAYVPLDPAYPRERLAFMIEDAGVPVVLTQERLLEELPNHEPRLICLDAEGQAIAGDREENLISGVAADDLAYVMYTSGSTGRPKGVMVCHRGVCNYLHWRQIYFPLTDADRLLQAASLSFDDSVWEFFEPLMVGARVVMARPGGQQASAYLLRLIAEQRITAACFVPSLLQVLLEEPRLKSCDCLRRVTTGGETLSIELQERFFARMRAGLHNGYGPTEATISATFWTCERGRHRRTVPVGRPIANTQIYLLDQNLQPVPIGVPGELHIGGDGLARGYLNRPELTAKRFIPDPFSLQPGARLYRTGDLARYLPDGNIEFLGRLDHQIKLRGFRIELGEVESVLNTHAAVRESVVVLREDATKQERLMAYIVPTGATPSPGKLRAFMKEKLPEYMVPAAFVMLEALPLMPNGKVDRRALPLPDPSSLRAENAYAEPRTPTEETLAGIWEEVLGLKQVDIHDDFFELGGHSLLAAQVDSRLRNAFGMELPLRSLFEAPTVAGLAEHIETLRRSDPAPSAAALSSDDLEEGRL